MIKFEFLRLRIDKVILRFYLLMAIVLIGGFTGIWWIAMLALPVFLSTMLAVKINLDFSRFASKAVSKEETYTRSKAI